MKSFKKQNFKKTQRGGINNKSHYKKVKYALIDNFMKLEDVKKELININLSTYRKNSILNSFTAYKKLNDIEKEIYEYAIFRAIPRYISNDKPRYTEESPRSLIKSKFLGKTDINNITKKRIWWSIKNYKEKMEKQMKNQMEKEMQTQIQSEKRAATLNMRQNFRKNYESSKYYGETVNQKGILRNSQGESIYS
jgi:hypothetical protein